ncbi:MAG: hypothetical protein WCQ57_08385 [Verrucomicrobiota bacterium]
MPTTRHIIVCEGESEWAYLQNLQRFLDSQPLPPETFATPLIFISPVSAVAKTGSFGKIKNTYNRTRTDNRTSRSIQIWADFDLYHRNDYKCAEHYAAKTAGIPDFLFSFHNFEDFFALHFDGNAFQEWLHFGGSSGQNHFQTPLHSDGYLPEIKRIFPGYYKGQLPTGFVSWASLRNLKTNLGHQPTSNPHILQGIRSFAEFLIREIEIVYPGCV